MMPVIAALVPVFVLILLGFTLRRLRFAPDDFWPPAEKLTYYVTFPALLFVNVAEARGEGLPWAAMTGSVAVATLTSAASMIAGRGLVPQMDGRSFSSMLQGSIRPNTYIGLAAAASLWGAEGLTLTAICIAVVVPLVNLLSVGGMLHYAAARRRGVMHLLLPIATNPLILACILGIAWNGSGLDLPPGIAPSLKILGSAALPIGLLAVGAGLDVSALRGAGLPVLLTSSLKLVLLPSIVLLGTRLADLPPLASGTAVLYAALPCSASAYVLARQMNGDAQLMATIITAQTLLAIVTIPLAVTLAIG